MYIFILYKNKHTNIYQYLFQGFSSPRNKPSKIGLIKTPDATDL